AANALAEDGGDLLVVEHRGRRTGRRIGRCAGQWRRRRRRRVLWPGLRRRGRGPRWRLGGVPRVGWSRCPLRQGLVMGTARRDQGDRDDSKKYRTDTHQCSPPCTPTRNLNATAALGFLRTDDI